MIALRDSKGRVVGRRDEFRRYPVSEEAKASGKIRQLSVGPLLARAVQSIHEETSVSALFL